MNKEDVTILTELIDDVKLKKGYTSFTIYLARFN